MYEWVEHTGELELAIEAETEEAVFAEALGALGELLDDGLDGREGREQVAVSAPDRPALLAEWLSELVYLAERDGFVPARVAELALAGERLTATVEGRFGSPAPLVKAVTYHHLALAREGERWRGRVVLDV